MNYRLEEKAKGILEAQKQLRLTFEKDSDIDVISTHPSPIFSWTSETVNCIALGEQMHKRRHWIIAKLQRPPAAHLAITDASSGAWKDFADSIKECVKAMKAD